MSLLHTEIQKAAYNGMDDYQIAASINAQTATVQQPIPVLDVKRYLMVVQKWPNIASIARGLITAPDATKLAAVALAEAFDSLTVFDLSVSAYANACNAELTANVSAGLIAQSDMDYILAMANVTVPLGFTLGFSRPIDHGDVATARVS